jgi:hypothetical protein
MTKLQCSVRVNYLNQRITRVVASVEEGMILCAGNEMDYHTDICRVTKGSHIEHL